MNCGESHPWAPVAGRRSSLVMIAGHELVKVSTRRLDRLGPTGASPGTPKPQRDECFNAWPQRRRAQEPKRPPVCWPQASGVSATDQQPDTGEPKTIQRKANKKRKQQTERRRPWGDSRSRITFCKPSHPSHPSNESSWEAGGSLGSPNSARLTAPTLPWVIYRRSLGSIPGLETNGNRADRGGVV